MNASFLDIALQSLHKQVQDIYIKLKKVISTMIYIDLYRKTNMHYVIQLLHVKKEMNGIVFCCSVCLLVCFV